LVIWFEKERESRKQRLLVGLVQLEQDVEDIDIM